MRGERVSVWGRGISGSAPTVARLRCSGSLRCKGDGDPKYIRRNFYARRTHELIMRGVDSLAGLRYFARAFDCRRGLYWRLSMAYDGYGQCLCLFGVTRDGRLIITPRRRNVRERGGR